MLPGWKMCLQTNLDSKEEMPELVDITDDEETDHVVLIEVKENIPTIDDFDEESAGDILIEREQLGAARSEIENMNLASILHGMTIDEAQNAVLELIRESQVRTRLYKRLRQKSED